MPQGVGYNNGRRLHDALASRGRNGDTMVAHISPVEAQMLKRMGGSGTTNPDTGLPEFFLSGIGTLLGGIGAVAGPLLAADQQEEAADISRQRTQQAAESADRAFELQTADRIDARGNLLRYNEDTNTFEVVPSPTTEEIIRAQDNEILRQLTEDAQRNRAVAERTFDVGEQAQPVLSENIEALGQPDQFTAEGIEGILQQEALAGVSDAFEGATAAAARNQARTGGDPTGRTFADLAEERAEANQEAMLSGARQALGLASDLNTADDQRQRGTISSLSPLVSGGRVNVAQPNIGSRLSNALSGRQSGAANASINAANTLTNTAQIPGVANTGLNIGGAIAGGGALLSDIGRLFGDDNSSVSSARERTRGNTSSGTGFSGVAAATPRRF